GVFPQFGLINPGTAGYFGTQVLTLGTGNIVVTDPNALNSAGAVYLFNGQTGALLSALTGNPGASTSDSGGNFGVTALSNGNYVVRSDNWDGNRGAVTWGSGTAGISGVVSVTNSLVGSNVNDKVGGNGVTTLSNGNYVVSSPFWN